MATKTRPAPKIDAEIAELLAAPINADRHPVEMAKTCTRCGGCGRYSWNAIHGDTCYGCSGTGYQYRFAAAQTAFRTAAKRLRYTDAMHLAVGEVIAVTPDTLRPVGDRKAGDLWATVTAVEITDKACAWSGPERTPTAWVVNVTVEHAGRSETFELYSSTIRRHVDTAAMNAARDNAVAEIPKAYRERVMAAWQAR